MNKTVVILITVIILAGCRQLNEPAKRLAIAEVGNSVLYYDEMPQLIEKGVNESDSVALTQNYINRLYIPYILFRNT